PGRGAIRPRRSRARRAPARPVARATSRAPAPALDSRASAAMIPSMPPRSRVHSVATPIAAVLVACHAPGAHAPALAALLDAVAENARCATPAGADVRITCSEGCTAAGRLAILLGRGDAISLEVRDGVRALVQPGHVLVARDGKAVPAAVGESLAGSDVLLEDLAVFTPAALKLPQISDDGPAGAAVTAAPAGPSPYALLVTTLAPGRRQ